MEERERQREREREREREERPADFLRALRVNLQAGILLASKTSLSLSLSLCEFSDCF